MNSFAAWAVRSRRFRATTTTSTSSVEPWRWRPAQTKYQVGNLFGYFGQRDCVGHDQVRRLRVDASRDPLRVRPVGGAPVERGSRR
jgi:hypothetical protein